MKKTKLKLIVQTGHRTQDTGHRTRDTGHRTGHLIQIQTHIPS